MQSCRMSLYPESLLILRHSVTSKLKQSDPYGEHFFKYFLLEFLVPEWYNQVVNEFCKRVRLNNEGPVCWGSRIHRLHLNRGVRHINEVLVGWGCRIHQLHLGQGVRFLQRVICHGLVAADRILCMGQIELNRVLMLYRIVWNRTVLIFKLRTWAKLNYLK